MKYKNLLVLLIAGSLVTISGCTLPWSQKEAATDTQVTSVCPLKPTDFGEIVGSGTGPIASTGSDVVVKYYLLDTCGKQVDRSTKEKMGEFPLTLGSGQVVPGFERAIFGMKAGESRDFTLAPSDAYGDLDKKLPSLPIPREQFEGVYVRVVDKLIYQDKGRLRQDISDPATLSGLTVGQEVVSSQDPSVTATIESISGSLVTFVYDNSKSPFYQKPLIVGTKGEKDGRKYEIIAVNGDELTIREEVPQYRTLESADIVIGKKLTIKAGTPLANNLARYDIKAGDEVEIIEIAGDQVVLALPNRQPQAGKSLVFHIEIVSVK